MNQGNTERYIRYKHKIVRDLAWVIGSPPLMHPNYPDSNFTTLSRKWCDAQFELHADWLEKLNQDPTPLQKHITRQKRFRLGKYFEELVLFWIQNSPQFEHLLHGVQIIEDGKTIGEADLLLRNKEQNRIEHWELAVKYYLCSEASNEWQQWIGPNPADTLERKMRTLIDKQLPLFQNPIAKNDVSKVDLTNYTSCLFLKGYFFSEFSLGKVQRPTEAAQPLNGWWCKMDAFRGLAQSSSTWVVLEKSWWLAPVVTDRSQLPLYNADEVRKVVANITTQGKSVLCAPMQQSDDLFIEQFKLFVVPDRWPTQ